MKISLIVIGNVMKMSIISQKIILKLIIFLFTNEVMQFQFFFLI